jgi:hypothetical protein
METFEIRLWKPTNLEIEINAKEINCLNPQSWEKNWEWLYNFCWALLEAKTLGHLIPKNPTPEWWGKMSKYYNNWEKLSNIIICNK